MVWDFWAENPRLHLRTTRHDLIQEILLHWLHRRDRYDPARGASKQTFMRRVVRAKLGDILEGELAQKRGGATERLSLDALADALEDEDARDPIAGALIDESPGPEAAAERAELRERTVEFIASLPPRQQQIVEGLLEELSMSELSRRLRVSRPTLYDDLGRVRTAFRNAGLEEFLD